MQLLADKSQARGLGTENANCLGRIYYKYFELKEIPKKRQRKVLHVGTRCFSSEPAFSEKKDWDRKV